MAELTKEDREVLVNGLISTCSCWEESDREILNSFTDDKLAQLAKQIVETAKAQAALAAAQEGTETHVYNEKSKRWELKEKDPIGTEPPRPAAKPKTVDEWLSIAPEEVQNTFRYAHEIEQRQKDEIIDKLTANIAGTDKRIHQERLRKRSLDDLRNDLALLPKIQQPDPQVANAGDEDWVSDLMSRAGRKLETVEDDGPLMLPTMNFQDVNEPIGTVGQTVKRAKYPTDTDWLKAAPPGVRAMVENAVAIENRERNQIIDQLTANVEDTEARLRLKDRLGEKSLEELRDLQALTRQEGGSSKRAANYVGAAAPASNQSFSNDDKDDILPLPTMNFWQERKHA
jgi:hypothetical protein